MADLPLTKTEFKALSSDSRTTMMKALQERNHTLSELSARLGMSAPTIKEHANVLVESGIIELRDEGRKWKYYSLTRKGRGILDAKRNQANILIILSCAGVLFLGVLFMVSGTMLNTSYSAAPSDNITGSEGGQTLGMPAQNGMGGAGAENTAAGIQRNAGVKKAIGDNPQEPLASSLPEDAASKATAPGPEAGTGQAGAGQGGATGAALEQQAPEAGDYSKMKCTPLFNAGALPGGYGFAENCTKSTTKGECLDVDYFSAAANEFGAGDGQPDCSWKEEEK